ncbi:TRAP transporter small permease [Halobacillus litoralis]|uniref:TRAP transporter small permease n=1 Tax=Halobacillus litoralis TaxID=45668 RepID=UPI0013707F3F|nr:TRAP transporter small permease [Halobacillus litoralis]MYL36920.1 TRAP transporter small permease subunit [Halobacillus litoralis]
MKVLKKIEETAIAFGLLSVTILLFVNIILRYVFSANTTWAEEFIRYVMIWITFIGAAVCFRRGMHVGVDFVLDLLKGKAKKTLELFIAFASIVFMALLIWFSMELVSFTRQTGQITPSLQIPLYYVYLAIPVGAALSLFHLIGRVVDIIKDRPYKETASNDIIHE